MLNPGRKRHSPCDPDNPNPKPTYASQSPARQFAREEADRLMLDPPKALIRWSIEEGVSLDNLDSGVWGNVESRMRNDGVLSVARTWRHDQINKLVEYKVTGRRSVAKEICMRVIIDRMAASKRHIMGYSIRADESEFVGVPAWLRWVALHPLMVPGAVDDPVLQSVARVYEKENPAPAMAMNYLRTCQIDAKQRDKLWDRVQKAQEVITLAESGLGSRGGQPRSSRRRSRGDTLGVEDGLEATELSPAEQETADLADELFSDDDGA